MSPSINSTEIEYESENNETNLMTMHHSKALLAVSHDFRSDTITGTHLYTQLT